MDIEFQSTPPSRVATKKSIAGTTERAFQSTPPSRVATAYRLTDGKWEGISIHTTLAGGDDLSHPTYMSLRRFQSTPPSRVATWK